MNLLLVDDDRYVLEGLMGGIHWEQLSVDNVLTARGSVQARELMADYTIHVMICDIEMPQGSGLDLVAWMREQGYGTQVIFLTSYATFDYARRALTLESYEYLLKPVDFELLTSVIARAMEKVTENERQQEYMTYGQYWLDSRADYKELYWTRILRQGYSDRVLETVPVIYEESDMFLMIQARIEAASPEDENLGAAMFEYRIKKLFEEVFSLPEMRLETAFSGDGGVFSAVFLLSGLPVQTWLHRQAEILIKKLKNIEACDIAIFIPEPSSLALIHTQLDYIHRLKYEYICFRNGIFTKINCHEPSGYEGMDTKLMEQYFFEGASDKLKFYLFHEIEQCIRWRYMGPDDMQNLVIDVMQLIFAILKENNIDAHLLFSSSENRRLYNKALDSYGDLKKYLTFLVETSISYMEKMKRTEDVVEQAMDYMRCHLKEEITRNSLAGMLYLNPDYFGKLFKKRTGESVIHYMTRMRMENAARQISSTKRSINDIAQEVGFGTVSYFAKKFKEYYGLNPSEYRESAKPSV